MGSKRRFAAVNTKVRVLKSRLLAKEDYIRLMRKEHIKEQVAYLKSNTVYGEVLENLEDLENIQEIESLLKQHLINQYNKFNPYFTGEYRKLFKLMLLRFEIEDLKLYLRILVNKDNFEISKNSFLLDSYYTNFNLNKLSKSKNLEEFIGNLEGTIYYNTLKPYINEENQRILFYMEMSLDRLFFNLLKDQSLKLDKDDRLLFEEILGKNIDLLNIEWIYRGKKFYKLSPEVLINYTLPYGYEFNYDRLKKMCYSTEDKLKETVLASRYDFLFDTNKDVDLYMERRTERYLYYQFVNSFKRGKLDIASTMAYIHLLEYEVRDIISILEAKRYGLSLNEAKEFLVRKIEGSDD